MVAENETIARPEAATAAAMLGQGMDPLPGSGSNGSAPHAEPDQAAPEREFADEPLQASLPIDGAPAAIPADDAFDGDYGGGAEIEAVAYPLIRDESRFSHLRQCVIRCRWKRKGGSRSGAPVFGAAVKAAGLVGHFSRADFILWLAADHCRTNAISREALEGLVKHQLLHIQPDPTTGELRVVGHDFEGFVDELAGDGPPQPWLAVMVHRAQQMPLMPIEPAEWPKAGEDEGDE